MVDSIYSLTGTQRISRVSNQHTDNVGTKVLVQQSYAPQRSYSASIAATGGLTSLVSAVTGRSIVLDSYVIISSVANSVKFLSNSTDLTGSMSIAVDGGVSANSNDGLIRTASGEALILSSTNSIAGHISYRLV